MTSYALIEVMSHHKLLYKRMQHVGVRCIAPLFRQPLNQAEVRQHGQLLRKNILACALLIYPGLFSHHSGQDAIYCRRFGEEAERAQERALDRIEEIRGGGEQVQRDLSAPHLNIIGRVEQVAQGKATQGRECAEQYQGIDMAGAALPDERQLLGRAHNTALLKQRYALWNAYS